MASLNSLYLKTETIEMLLKVAKAKQLKGVEITVSIADTENQYGQNVSGYVSQTKEEREAKKPRYYVGNGKTFWKDTNNEQQVKEEEVKAVEAEVVNDDLPF